MKKLLLLLLIAGFSISSAQWIRDTNYPNRIKLYRPATDSVWIEKLIWTGTIKDSSDTKLNKKDSTLYYTVSAASQALGGKANSASPTFTGTATGDTVKANRIYEDQPVVYNSRKVTLVSPYVTKSNVYKGQLHDHTTNSADGLYSPTDVVSFYKWHGYNFVAITDHDTVTLDPVVAGMLVIKGVEEWNGGYHIGRINVTNAIGAYNNHDTYQPQNIIDSTESENGFTTIHHPYATGGASWPWVLMEAIDGYTAVEVWNALAGANGNSETRCDSLLSRGRRFYLTATDDMHDTTAGTAGTASVRVFANALTNTEIMENLRRGNFYSSSGANITSITVSKNVITVVTDAASTIDFVIYGGVTAQTSNSATTASYTVFGDEIYIRIRIVRDSDGLKAWSNPIYTAIAQDMSHGGVVRENLIARKQISAGGAVTTHGTLAAKGSNDKLDVFDLYRSGSDLRVVRWDSTGCLIVQWIPASGGWNPIVFRMTPAVNGATMDMFDSLSYPRIFFDSKTKSLYRIVVYNYTGGTKNFWVDTNGAVFSNDAMAIGANKPTYGLAIKGISSDVANTNTVLNFQIDQQYWGFRLSATPLADYVIDRRYGGSNYEWLRGTRATGTMALYGGLRVVGDTLRIGDYTTYDYLLPGGDLVKSSSQSLKTNIQNYTADLTKFKQVTPRKYNFKKDLFLKDFDESSVPDSVQIEERQKLRQPLIDESGRLFFRDVEGVTTKTISNKTAKDSARTEFYYQNNKDAERKSKIEYKGFLAEEFNKELFGKDSKEINNADVINTLWLKVQELEKRIELLESKF